MPRRQTQLFQVGDTSNWKPRQMVPISLAFVMNSIGRYEPTAVEVKRNSYALISSSQTIVLRARSSIMM